MKNYLSVFLILFLVSQGCKKKSNGGVTPIPPPVDTTVVIEPAVDPPVASTVGFFLDDWQPKTFTAPSYTESPTASLFAINTVTVNASDILAKIPRSVFGHNANTWMGTFVGDAAFMTHVTNLHPHVIRFPAGSGSDAYFWNSSPNNLPADVPLQIMDKDGVKKDPGFGYGKTTDNWRASLTNYYDMLLQSNNQGLLTVNYGYARYGTGANPVAAAAHLVADWVRYDNGRTKYWEIGNENFGDWEWGYRIDVTQNKDGQPEYLTGALYAQHFKVFADSMRKAAAEIGKTIFIGAVTVEAAATESWQTNTLKTWNAGMMANINGKADFYVVHNYFTPYNTNANATEILTAAATVPISTISYVSQAIQTYGAAAKPVVLDEWNMFSTGSKQQVSNVSGLFATIVLGEVIKNKYGLAARWDLLNGWSNGDDHGLFSAGDEPGIARWSPRPSFYYMYFMQKTIGDRMVSNIYAGNAGIKAYSSTFSSGEMQVTLVNTTTIEQNVEIKTKNFRVGNRYYWYTLEGGTDNGEFSRKVAVNGSSTGFDAGGPADYATIKARSALTGTGIKVKLPARGAVNLVIEKK